MLLSDVKVLKKIETIPMPRDRYDDAIFVEKDFDVL